MKGKNVNLVLNMPNGVRWTINGTTVKTDKIGDIDMGVVINSNSIPSNLVQKVAGGKTHMQISLNHDGEFGFDAVLTLYVGVGNAGRYARLYYYNKAKGKMEYQTGCKIDGNGDASLRFTHASDYVIVIDDIPVVKTGDDTPLVQGVLLLLAGLLVLAFVVRKKKGAH